VKFGVSSFKKEIKMSSSCIAEFVGWAVLVIFTAKTVYNLIHFAYTTFLGRLLGRGIDLKSCGPWAGIFIFNLQYFHACSY
jgi:hypothetical protein